MKITSENYKKVFSSFNEKISAIHSDGNSTVEEALSKLKEEFEKREHGSEVLLADNSVLKIGIVGQVKAGKSSFLNSLFFDGENILPRASTPMTAGLTILKYGEENKFIVEYFNEKEWSYFVDKAAEYDQLIKSGKAQNPALTDADIETMLNIGDTEKSAKEMVSKCTRSALTNIQKVSKKDEKTFGKYADLQNILEDYVGANGKLTSIVKCLTVELKDERLKNIQIVDTPGVNDPVLSRERRTCEFLQECHGVFFLSNCTSFFGSTDVGFLVDRIGSQGIGTVVLLGSMLDAGLMDASGKYHDDLGNALDYVKTSLNRQYRNNIADSDFNGDDPVLDFCSGIGYSIAKKGRSKWDDMEAHVVSRMCELYPSFFSDDESIKEMFSALANIDGEDGIREKYLEGLFKENMDKIIHQKLDSYFSNASGELTKILEKHKDTISSQLKSLKECENPEEQRVAMQKLIGKMKNEIFAIMNRVDSRADKAVKDVMNSYSMNWDGNIPKSPKGLNCNRKTTNLGRSKSLIVDVEVINGNKLVNDVVGLVEKKLNNLAKVWEEKNKGIRSFISDSINDFISGQENNDTENRIDGRMLSTILNETLDQMTSEATLDISQLKHKVMNDIPTMLTGCDDISTYCDVCSEDEARSKISKNAKAKIDQATSQIREYLSGLYPDVQTLIKKASQTSTSCIKGRKDEFITHISTEINKKIDQLEIQVKDRNKNLAILTSAIDNLNKIQKEL